MDILLFASNNNASSVSNQEEKKNEHICIVCMKKSEDNAFDSSYEVAHGVNNTRRKGFIGMPFLVMA